jgi:kynurenine formamidase
MAAVVLLYLAPQLSVASLAPSSSGGSGLIRFDLSLPTYFTFPPAPGVAVKPQITRTQPKALYMRGEMGEKSDGSPRPITAHSTTHIDVPFHFYEQGADLAAVLNRTEWVADRPCTAALVVLEGKADAAGHYTRDGVSYVERITAADLPSERELREAEALVVLTGFGRVMAAQTSGQFPRNPDGFYHVPWLDEGAVDRILASGVKLIGLDSTTVEPQTSSEPHRMGSDAHFRLLGHTPPVLILECLNGGRFAHQVGFVPHRALLHVVPRRVNPAGADAAPSRVFLYFYRGDPDGQRLAALRDALMPGELYG